MISAPIGAVTNQQVAYGVDSNVDSLYTIDVDSGAITIVGSLGSRPDDYTTPIALAVRRSDGAMFVANNSPDVDRGISRIDPKTGRATLVAPYGSPFFGMTFGAQDQLIVQLQSSDRLAVVDLDTGDVQTFGSLELPIMYSLATNPIDGEMYGLSQFFSPGELPVEQLHHISASGNLTSTISLSTGPGQSATLAFDSSGALYVIASGGLPPGGFLYQVDPATGARLSPRIEITFPYVPQGFAFAAPVRKAVPVFSPIGLLLLIFGLWGPVVLMRTQTGASFRRRA